MALDLKNLPGPTRKAYIELGGRYQSENTLAQANKTLAGYGKHSQKIKNGFTARDAEKLKEARDMLIAAGVGREGAQTRKRVTTSDYAEQVRTGATSRFQVRSVLEGVKEDLNETVGEEAMKTALVLGAVLDQTSRGRRNASKLADQIQAMVDVMEGAQVAPLVAERSEEGFVDRVKATIQALRKAHEKNIARPGTPAETEHLDLVDGIIVKLVRRARKAGRAAALELGAPAMADDFALDLLYVS